MALWLGAQALGQTGRGPQVALPLAGYRTLEHQVTSLGLGSSSEGKRESHCHVPGREERHGVRNNTEPSNCPSESSQAKVILNT